MKKQVVSEQRVCDICEKWCYDSCLGCGVDHCYDHRKELGVSYHYSATHEGHGDGYYCRECDERLRASADDPLHIAYLEMKALREEWVAVHEGLAAKNKTLSRRIECLYDKRRD